MTLDDALAATAARPQAPQLPDLAAGVRGFPVRPSEKPWTVAEVRTLADELVTDIARLRVELVDADADLTALLRYSGDGAGDDQADSGSTALEREQELTLVNNTRDLLDQSVAALARVGAPGFGACESCGDPIGKARLQAFPRAALCVTCKARQERR